MKNQILRFDIANSKLNWKMECGVHIEELDVKYF